MYGLGKYTIYINKHVQEWPCVYTSVNIDFLTCALLEMDPLPNVYFLSFIWFDVLQTYIPPLFMFCKRKLNNKQMTKKKEWRDIQQLSQKSSALLPKRQS